MPGFEHVETAQKVRDIIRSAASQVVTQQSPRPNFGRVISVDFVSKTATVWFPGDDKPVSVNLFSSTFPGQWHEKFSGSGGGVESTSRTGYGSIVAVENFNGKLYVTEVLNGGQFSIDSQSAGIIPMQHGVDGLPFNPAGGDYSFFVLWDTFGSNTQAALPSNGGPFAINIGPFIYWNTGPPPSSEHEVEISGWLGQSHTYRFSLNSYWQMAKNNFSSIYDRWFRLIPDKLNEDDVTANNNRTINKTTNVSVDLGDWTAGTNTSVLRSTAFSNSGLASMKIRSTNAAQTVLEAVTDTARKYQIVAGATYSATFDGYSPSAWAAGVRTSVNWYDASEAFISTMTGTATALTAATWTSVFTDFYTPPSNAKFAVFKVQVIGTPSTSQDFYADNIKFNSIGSVSKTEVSLDVALRKTQHGATDSELSNSSGELWIRVYIHWLDAVSNPNWTVRYRNAGGWAQAKSTQTGKVVYEYKTTPSDAVGYLGYHDSNAVYTTNTTQIGSVPSYGTWSTGPWKNPDLTLARRAQNVLSGGGIITWDGSYLKWSSPFEIGGVGRSRHGLNGQNARPQLNMPTSGTIPNLPQGGSTTVVASGINLLFGDSLWFGIPPGCSDTIPMQTYFNGGLHGTGGLFIVSSSSLEYWNVPEWAVLIAYCQSDASQPQIKLGNGQIIDKWRSVTFTNNWASYDTSLYNAAGYRLEGGRVWLRGLVKNTVSNAAASAMFTLPAGYRPDKTILTVAMSAQTGVNGLSRVSVSPAGVVAADNHFSGGGAGFLSLEQVSFDVRQ